MGTLTKIALSAGGIVVVFLAVVIFRTFTYGHSAAISDVYLPKAPPISAQTAAQHLGEAIQFRTITVATGDPRPGLEGPWLELQKWLSNTYPNFHQSAEMENVPGGLSLLYSWKGSNQTLKPILLMAHQDVVPVNIGTESDWDASPFSGKILNGYVYGRGAIDDKSGLIGIMEALEALAKSEFSPRRTIHVLLGHDEEVSGSGAGAGVELLKSRGIELLMALDEGSMVLENFPLTGKPLGLIGVAEKGYLTLHITAIAQGGHSSTPSRDSAVVRLSKAIIALDKNQMPSNLSRPPISELFEAAGPDMPFLMRMVFANQWIFGGILEAQLTNNRLANATIRTTTAPTMLAGSSKENVLAQRAQVAVNFRIHPNDTEEDIIEHVKRVTKHIEGIEINVGRTGIRGSGASPVSPTDNATYKVLAAIARNVTNGVNIAPALVVGATDGRYAYAITDSVYRFVPAVLSSADLSGFHGTNERMSVENISRMANGYAQIVLALDALDE